LEAHLSDMHVRMAEAEGRKLGGVRAHDGVLASLTEDRDRLTKQLEDEVEHAKQARECYLVQVEKANHEAAQVHSRLTAAISQKQHADSRAEKYKTKLREREIKYEEFKRAILAREREYRTAISRLKRKVENHSLHHDLDRGQDGENLEVIRKLLGVTRESGEPPRRVTDRARRHLTDNLLNRQSRAGKFMENLIQTAEADLEELEARQGSADATMCEQLRDHIEGLRRAAKRLRNFKHEA